MRNTWILATNIFETSTENNYSRAATISTFHYNALSAQSGDIFIGPLFIAYSIIHFAYMKAYNDWKNQKDKLSGKTLNLNQLLDLLTSEKIDKWDNAIRLVYSRKSSDYKSLMPNKRKFFQRGSQLKRITAVSVLNEKLTGIAALASTKIDVNNFLTLLNDGYSLQKQNKSATAIDSKNVEDARITMTTAMFSNYGAFIQKFASTPDIIAKFFDEKTIRNASQVVFTGHLKPGKLHAICRRTFAATDILEITNDNDTILNIYLGYNKKFAVPEDAYSIPANTHISITGEKLGNLENNYLIISNPHASIKAAWKVKIE